MISMYCTVHTRMIHVTCTSRNGPFFSTRKTRESIKKIYTDFISTLKSFLEEKNYRVSIFEKNRKRKKKKISSFPESGRPENGWG